MGGFPMGRLELGLDGSRRGARNGSCRVFKGHPGRRGDGEGVLARVRRVAGILAWNRGITAALRVERSIVEVERAGVEMIWTVRLGEGDLVRVKEIGEELVQQAVYDAQAMAVGLKTTGVLVHKPPVMGPLGTTISVKGRMPWRAGQGLVRWDDVAEVVRSIR